MLEGGAGEAPGRTFSETAIAQTCTRAVRERWTLKDVEAALLQSTLISYRSRNSDAAIYGGDTGHRYSNSAPEMYTYNCPWNDWTPPSESERLFREAAQARARACEDHVSRRVRVRIVSQTQTGTKDTVVFATLEVNDAGKEVLVLRRGADTLASLVKRRIRVTPDPNDPCLNVLTVRNRNVSAPSLLLRFEDTRRLEIFSGWLARA